MKNCFDVAIVGGGISGITAAYRLSSCAKGLRVALFDKNKRDGSTLNSSQVAGCWLSPPLRQSYNISNLFLKDINSYSRNYYEDLGLIEKNSKKDWMIFKPSYASSSSRWNNPKQILGFDAISSSVVDNEVVFVFPANTILKMDSIGTLEILSKKAENNGLHYIEGQKVISINFDQSNKLWTIKSQNNNNNNNKLQKKFNNTHGQALESTIMHEGEKYSNSFSNNTSSDIKIFTAQFVVIASGPCIPYSNPNEIPIEFFKKNHKSNKDSYDKSNINSIQSPTIDRSDFFQSQNENPEMELFKFNFIDVGYPLDYLYNRLFVNYGSVLDVESEKELEYQFKYDWLGTPSYSNPKMLTLGGSNVYPDSKKTVSILSQILSKEDQLVTSFENITKNLIVKILNRKRGVRVFRSDRIPLVGPVVDQNRALEEKPDIKHGKIYEDLPLIPNLFIQGAFAGRGYTHAPFTSLLIQKLILKEKLSELENKWRMKLFPSKLFTDWARRL